VSGSSREGWIAGLAVGAAGGFLALELPILGWGIVMAFAVIAVLRGPRLPAEAGLLTGVGTSWILLLGRGILECRAFNEVPGQGCSQPDLGPWLIAGGTMLALGVAGTVLAVGRTRRNR
jgi:hypothetical protein